MKTPSRVLTLCYFVVFKIFTELIWERHLLCLRFMMYLLVIISEGKQVIYLDYYNLTVIAAARVTLPRKALKLYAALLIYKSSY